MFKKKVKTKSLWESEEALSLHYLQQKNDINEYQRNLKMVDGGEYQATRQDIDRYIRQLESKYAFDEMMGNPMDQLEGIFNDVGIV